MLFFLKNKLLTLDVTLLDHLLLDLDRSFCWISLLALRSLLGLWRTSQSLVCWRFHILFILYVYDLEIEVGVFALALTLLPSFVDLLLLHVFRRWGVLNDLTNWKELLIFRRSLLLCSLRTTVIIRIFIHKHLLVYENLLSIVVLLKTKDYQVFIYCSIMIIRWHQSFKEHVVSFDADFVVFLPFALDLLLSLTVLLLVVVNLSEIS